MKPRHLSLFRKTGLAALQNANSWETLVEQLRDVELSGREQVHVVVLGSNVNLTELLQSSIAPSGLRHLGSGPSLSLFEYHRKFGRDGHRMVSGNFVVARTSRDTIYLLVFVSEPRFWRSGVQPLVDWLYPRAACPFLTQGELHELLSNVQRAISPERLRILEFSSRKRLGATSRKRFQSVREWTDMELDDAFAEAKERNDWFRSVSFDIVPERGGRLAAGEVNAQISKYGHFSCSGRLDFFAGTIIRQMVEIGADRLKFFSNRDRQRTTNHAPAPLQIAFSTDVFRSKEQGKRFISIMQKFKSGSCTVLHANPYIHIALVDNRDLTSADIWVLSQSEIVVVPQIRASGNALKRIVNHIFENFREGKISEYK
jgi:hypothetical protein